MTATDQPQPRQQRQPTEAEEDKTKAEAEASRAAADASRASAEASRADARKSNAEAETAEHGARVASIFLDREVDKRHREKLADDFNHHRYVFDTAVSDASVKSCIKQLNQWDREDATCDIEIMFSSPGGSVIDGMELFDFISSLRDKTGANPPVRTITTSTHGMAASMAGILLQAGDVRVCGSQAYILIHEVAFGAMGKIGEIEDEVKFVRKIQKRVLNIFAERCMGADPSTATKRLSRRQLATGWERKDWWVDSDEALAYGLVDVVR